MVVSTANCDPHHKGNPSTTISNRRPSRWLWAPRSMSRTAKLVLTRPPASRQTRAATFSSTQPRRPKTPAFAHAARWWPRTSRGGPHRQERGCRGNGSRKRRKKSNRNGWGSMRVSFMEGMATNAAEAVGPACDLSRAAWASSSAGKTVCRRIAESTTQVAFFCQPRLGCAGSNSSSSR